MAHELAALPPSMLKETWKIRDAKTKSNLKNAVKVGVWPSVSSRGLFDGWVCHTLGDIMANHGTVKDFFNRFRKHVTSRDKTGDVAAIIKCSK